LTGTFSQNDLYLLVYGADSGGWRILDLIGNTIISESTMGGALAINGSQWRWDRASDSVIWNTSGNTLYKCTINPGAGTLNCSSAHVFSEYAYSVVFPSDTDVNPSGWVPMVGQAVDGSTADVFLYNLNTGTKSAVAYTTTCTGDANDAQPLGDCIHRLVVTPNNGFTAEFNGSVGIEAVGQYLWEPGFSSLKEIEGPTTDHHDVGKDQSSNEVAVYEDPTGYAHANLGGPPIGTCTSIFSPSTVMLSSSMVSNAAPTSCLFDTPANPGWHVSFRAWPKRAWVVFSAQGSNNSELFNNNVNFQMPSVGGWTLYSNEIMLERIDAANDMNRIYRLALSHSREREDYWAEPHAVISRTGNYILFGSNAAWGATGCGGDGNPTNCADLYLIKIH